MRNYCIKLFQTPKKAVEFKVGIVPGDLTSDTLLDEIRKDARFQELMERCHLVVI